MEAQLAGIAVEHVESLEVVLYDGTVLPLVAGFAVLSLASIAAAWWAEGATPELRVA